MLDPMPTTDDPGFAARQRMAICGEFKIGEFELEAAECDHVPALKIPKGAPPLPLESAADRDRVERERRAQDDAQAQAYADRQQHAWSMSPSLIITDGDGNDLDNVIEFRRQATVAVAAPSANNNAVLRLSDDQATAIDRIMAWLATDEQVLTVGGLAGTGKTTLMATVVRTCNRIVATCAFTGKAAHVLRTKGISEARTIHSLIYESITTCRRCGMTVKESGEDEDHGPKKTRCRRPACMGAKTDTHFERTADLGECQLIIVDEASMVSTKIHEDLLSFGIKILYVGDHGQLEPIGENPRLLHAPAIRLEKIHRQAEGSDILRFAHHVRSHGRPESMGQDVIVVETTVAPKNVENYDVVICGRNSTRVAVNAAIRKARGYTTPLPVPGERVICLRNDATKKIFNGMVAQVVEVRMGIMVSHPEIDIRLDTGEVRRGIRFAPEQFGKEKPLDDAHMKISLFDYGYCLTVWKSQGSAWDNVLVLERINQETSAARWRYTAATRAKKTLTWCMRPQRTRKQR